MIKYNYKTGDIVEYQENNHWYFAIINEIVEDSDVPYHLNVFSLNEMRWSDSKNIRPLRKKGVHGYIPQITITDGDLDDSEIKEVIVMGYIQNRDVYIVTEAGTESVATYVSPDLLCPYSIIAAEEKSVSLYSDSITCQIIIPQEERNKLFFEKMKAIEKELNDIGEILLGAEK